MNTNLGASLVPIFHTWTELFLKNPSHNGSCSRKQYLLLVISLFPYQRGIGMEQQSRSIVFSLVCGPWAPMNTTILKRVLQAVIIGFGYGSLVLHETCPMVFQFCPWRLPTLTSRGDGRRVRVRAHQHYGVLKIPNSSSFAYHKHRDAGLCRKRSINCGAFLFQKFLCFFL